MAITQSWMKARRGLPVRSLARERGITLIELMVALVIVALLAGIGYPSYQTYVLRSKRSDAKVQLSRIASQQEQYFSNTRTYTDDLTELGYGDEDWADSPEEFWQVTVEAANNTSFTLYATPANGHADEDCDRIYLTGLGEKRSKADGMGDDDFNDPGTCW